MSLNFNRSRFLEVKNHGGKFGSIDIALFISGRTGYLERHDPKKVYVQYLLDMTEVEDPGIGDIVSWEMTLPRRILFFLKDHVIVNHMSIVSSSNNDGKIFVSGKDDLDSKLYLNRAIGDFHRSYECEGNEARYYRF